MAGVLAVGGCAGGESHPAAGEHQADIVFSPNGEPLSGGPLGHPSCKAALSGWFARLDADHKGTIDQDQFLTDARTQFARMDVHQIGYVTAADLSEFRAPYEPPAESAAAELRDLPPDTDSSHKRTRTRGDDARPNPFRNGVDTRADPVMSADKSLSFKVTLADFVAHAGEVFQSLNTRHDGHLTKDEVLASCHPTKAK